MSRPPPTTVVTPTASCVFDGIRGIAIVLVVLSHGVVDLAPRARRAHTLAHARSSASGNFAVSIFFVVGAFLATRSLLRGASTAEGLRPGVQLRPPLPPSQRPGRASCCSSCCVRHGPGRTPTPTPRPRPATRSLRIATYTWNWYLQANALVARPDLGTCGTSRSTCRCSCWSSRWSACCGAARRGCSWPLAVILLVVCALAHPRLPDRGRLPGPAAHHRPHGRPPRRRARRSPRSPTCARLRPAGRPRWPRLAALSLGRRCSYLNVGQRRLLPGGPACCSTWPRRASSSRARVAPASHGRHAACSGSRRWPILGRRSLSLYIWHFPIFLFLSRHSRLALGTAAHRGRRGADGRRGGC